MKRTDEYVAHGRLPSFLVGQKVLVSFETSEANGHFGNDPGKDGAETFVKRQRGFSLDDLNSGRDKPSWFRLSSLSSDNRVKGRRSVKKKKDPNFS